MAGPTAGPPVYEYWRRVVPHGGALRPFDATAPGAAFELQREAARGRCYADAMRKHRRASRTAIRRAILAEPQCAILFPELQAPAVARRQFVRLTKKTILPLVKTLVGIGLVSAYNYPMLSYYLVKTSRLADPTAFLSYLDYLLNALLNHHADVFGGQKAVMRLISEKMLPFFAAPRMERQLRTTLESMASTVFTRR